MQSWEIKGDKFFKIGYGELPIQYIIQKIM